MFLNTHFTTFFLDFWEPGPDKSTTPLTSESNLDILFV